MNTLKLSIKPCAYEWQSDFFFFFFPRKTHTESNDDLYPSRPGLKGQTFPSQLTATGTPQKRLKQQHKNQCQCRVFKSNFWHYLEGMEGNKTKGGQKGISQEYEKRGVERTREESKLFSAERCIFCWEPIGVVVWDRISGELLGCIQETAAPCGMLPWRPSLKSWHCQKAHWFQHDSVLPSVPAQAFKNPFCIKWGKSTGNKNKAAYRYCLFTNTWRDTLCCGKAIVFPPNSIRFIAP